MPRLCGSIWAGFLTDARENYHHSLKSKRSQHNDRQILKRSLSTSLVGQDSTPRKLASSTDSLHFLRYTAVMKTPFPGMDPYLEQYWGDVHHGLIQYTRDALQPCLPNDLRARVEERVFVESEPERIRQVVPDVYVSQVYRDGAA